MSRRERTSHTLYDMHLLWGIVGNCTSTLLIVYYDVGALQEKEAGTFFY